MKDLNAADLHGLSRLAVRGVVETTSLVEQVHHTIARISPPIGRERRGRARGISGLVYRSIQGVTGLVGGSLDLAFEQLSARPDPGQFSPERDAFLAILNGVLGDHLATTANPLAIPMRLRHQGRPVVPDRSALASLIEQPSPRLLIAAHGLCQSDRCWLPKDDQPAIDLPGELSRTHGYTSLSLHYNTGRPIAANGRDLDALLESIIEHWPVPIEEIVLLGHSMGGLVSRSACHYGRVNRHAWPGRVRRLIFLGTPHHGSPLERAGHGVDRLLGISPYSAPFARLGRMRSAGITDLRHGRIVDAAGHSETPLSRAMLPEPVKLHAIAATPAERLDRFGARLLGDGLVPIDSALGRHADPDRCLPIPAAHQRILTSTSHMGLLHHASVLETLHDWLQR